MILAVASALGSLFHFPVSHTSYFNLNIAIDGYVFIGNS